MAKLNGRDLTPVEADLGKELILAQTFTDKGAFDAYNGAESYCKSLGLSVGRMCAGLPTGLKKGGYDIQKWRNLSFEDKALLDGVLMGDFRNGPVAVYLSKEVCP
jgi:hypothetical protein